MPTYIVLLIQQPHHPIISEATYSWLAAATADPVMLHHPILFITSSYEALSVVLTQLPAAAAVSVAAFILSSLGLSSLGPSCII